MTDGSGYIYHIAEVAAWEAQRPAGSYSPASFESDGFIHCSIAKQVEGTVRRFFADRSDLLLLTIDIETLVSPLRWEEGEPGELYPHLYGPLNVDAVIEVETLKQWKVRAARGG